MKCICLPTSLEDWDFHNEENENGALQAITSWKMKQKYILPEQLRLLK